jgi:phosphatidylinositol alpha-1,6-mannosyltransferase
MARFLRTGSTVTATATQETVAQVRRTRAREILVLTEHFPPAVGGSSTLFDEIYRRIKEPAVTVITQRRSHVHPNDSGGLAVVEDQLTIPNWGIARPAALRHHWRIARGLKARTRTSGAIVHCGRALPEGVAAWLSRLSGGPRYLCWAHGEDLAMARSSRELTYLTTRVFLSAEFALANSRNTANMLVDFGIPVDRIVIVYPGVDADRFSPTVDGAPIRNRLAPGADIVVLSVGRLQRRKGHDLAIRTLSRLRSSLPKIMYLIAGDGEDREYLERLAEANDVVDRVRFLGDVPSAVLPQLYAASDIFLLPNRIENGDIEGFGIVFLEAASAGKPVIGGNTGGVPEAVLDGVTGLLVTGTDVDELSGAVARLATDSSLRARFGKAGRRRIEASFTWERAADIVRQVHQRIQD